MVTDDDDIRALRAEAGSAGDLEQVAVCDRALDGSGADWDECVRVIGEAAAMEQECGHEPEGREVALGPAFDIDIGDWITYRSIYPEVPDFRARVVRFDGRNRGLVVVDEQPGFSLEHMVRWDRVVGKADG